MLEREWKGVMTGVEFGARSGASGASRDEPAHGPPVRPAAPVDALIPAAIAGDDDAFVSLYRDINPRLRRYAVVLVGQDAEDVVSEAWLQIARDLPRFRGGMDDLRAWTARIVRNRCLDHIRAVGRRPLTTHDLSAIVDRPGPYDTEEAAVETIATGHAIALIATLPQGQAEAVLLRVVLGLDPVASGKILKRRPGAVRVAAHRGLQRLATELAALDRPGGDGHE